MVRARDAERRDAPAVREGRAYKIGFYLGYAELTPDGHHFNTAILVDRDGKIVGKYRKVHLPGHSEFDTERAFQHLEKRYFEPGNLGFPVWRTMGGIFGMACATTAAGPRPIASWACKASRWSCSATTRRR